MNKEENRRVRRLRSQEADTNWKGEVDTGHQVRYVIFKISEVELFLMIKRATVWWSNWKAEEESPWARREYLTGYSHKHWSHLEWWQYEWVYKMERKSITQKPKSSINEYKWPRDWYQTRRKHMFQRSKRLLLPWQNNWCLPTRNN